MAQECFSLARAISTYETPQYQTCAQNYYEDEFNWHIEQMKKFGAEVSPVKRSMRAITDPETDEVRMLVYYQSIIVTASDDVIAQLKQKYKP